MNEHQQVESLTLKRIFNDLYKDRITILLISFFVTLISVVYSLSLNNIYRSETYLKLSENPANYSETSSLSEAAGGLGSILGLGLGNNDKLILANVKKNSIKVLFKIINSKRHFIFK